MKVQVTLELDDDQRVAVGLMETGKFVPATRAQVRSFVENESMMVIESAAQVVIEQRQRIADQVRRELGISASNDAAGDSAE